MTRGKKKTMKRQYARQKKLEDKTQDEKKIVKQNTRQKKIETLDTR